MCNYRNKKLLPIIDKQFVFLFEHRSLVCPSGSLPFIIFYNNDYKSNLSNGSAGVKFQDQTSGNLISGYNYLTVKTESIYKQKW